MRVVVHHILVAIYLIGVLAVFTSVVGETMAVFTKVVFTKNSIH